MQDTKQTIMITGAGNGIGRAALMHFHGLGWRVIGLDLDDNALSELRETLPGDTALLLACDVGKEKPVAEAFESIADWIGEDAIHCLVNNSGIADPYSGPLEDLSLEKWQAWIDASLTAAFLVSRSAIPFLRRAAGNGDSASVVNISSTRAVMSEPKSYAYASAKGGLDALTHAMAVTLGPDIRINAIRPGWIETGPWQKKEDRSNPDHRDIDRDQHPVGRIGEPQDIAEAIQYLHEAGFVTGQHLNVDGGMTVKMIYEH